MNKPANIPVNTNTEPSTNPTISIIYANILVRHNVIKVGLPPNNNKMIATGIKPHVIVDKCQEAVSLN